MALASFVTPSALYRGAHSTASGTLARLGLSWLHWWSLCCRRLPLFRLCRLRRRLLLRRRRRSLRRRKRLLLHLLLLLEAQHMGGDQLLCERIQKYLCRECGA